MNLRETIKSVVVALLADDDKLGELVEAERKRLRGDSKDAQPAQSKDAQPAQSTADVRDAEKTQ